MAVVILGGLVSTTLVSLFLLPAMYLRFGTPATALSPAEDLLLRWIEPEPEAEPQAEPATPAATAEQERAT
jgi:hypothetical protein